MTIQTTTSSTDSRRSHHHNEGDDGTVNSAGSNIDIGSVGSTSTNKTRFSFYNAQEVQQEERSHHNQQQLNSSNSVLITTSTLEEDEEVEMEKVVLGGATEESPTTSKTNKEEQSTTMQQQPPEKPDSSSSLEKKNSGNSRTSTTENQRFTFYTAEDEAEEDDQPRSSPKAAANEFHIDTTSNSSNSNHSNTLLPTPLATAETPQRGNHNKASASSSQKKKLKAVAAAQARSRSSKKNSTTTPTAAFAIMNNGDNTLEILQSLKDTEQMRRNLMKECQQVNNNSNNNSDTADDENQEGTEQQQQQPLDTTSVIENDATADETIQQEGVLRQAPALEFSAAAAGTNDDEYYHQDTTAASAAALSQALSQIANTTTTTRDSNNSSGTRDYSNPYEDAIREALDLLRKHRPPSPHINSTSEGDDGGQVGGGTNTTTTSALPMRTPREHDRILQSRWQLESPNNLQYPHHHTTTTTTTTHDPEELEARKKERQERMARYTTRLAELKNGEDSSHPTSSFPNNNDNTTTAKDDEDSKKEEDGQPSTPSLQQQQYPQQYQLTTAQQDILRSSSSRSPLPPQSVVQTPSAGDISLGTASSLSASHYHPQNQKEVHRSVERVLLAILERAHSNGRGPMHTSSSSQTSSHVQQQQHQHPPLSLEPTPDPSWQNGEEKKSSNEDDENKSGDVDVVLTPSQQQSLEDPLLRAVGELLSGGSRSVADDSPQSNNRQSQQSSVTSGGARRSVVEELLAEAESFGGDHLPRGSQSSRSKPYKSSKSISTQSLTDLKRNPEDLLNSSTGVEAVRSDTDVETVVVDKELDDLVLKTLGMSATEGDLEVSVDYNGDEENDDKDYVDDDDDDEGETQSHTYEEEGSYEEGESDDELDEALAGVLGPLSKNAGTTGVVLESPTSPDRSIFDSLSNAMSSLVASAMSGDEKPTVPTVGSDSKSLPRDKYATDMDHVEYELDTEEAQETTDTSVEDEEANELMRTLCAHLLPFGVDQSNRFLDEVPQWDDSNPNEAGYRIIRLTSQQLERVEIAFETMVLGLKKHSEQNLLDRDKRNATDATFERDLAAAEKVLEEEDRTTKIMKVLNLVPETPTSVEDSRVTSSDDESSTESGDDSSVDAASANADDCHPDFPGIHSAGKGEMGDLEYFHLPVIFKSHVTGFEPTKDLCLETGNVVAGQYLVESELGSAAFSTAYRCVDLNSEGDDTEDGHQEVCLKVIKNTKDFFDQSLDEIKILELLRQTGKCHENYIVEMKTFFYHREHLIIVTELLRQNLFEFGKFILDHDEEAYFTVSRLAFITRQVLIALRFVHKLGLVHSDVKPENILLGSYSRAQVKLIDFGSSCYLTDRQSSYIQSRSYRAPEVVLGLPYDGKIDVWSLGCVVAEMFTGEVTFQNDSIVSMLSRIEAICGPFPRHMIAQGRQTCRFFTKCGLLFEKVPGQEDGQKTPDESEDDDDDEESSEIGRRNSRMVYDIFQPKTTTFSSRLGFAPDLHDRYASGATLSPMEQKQAMFVDFVRKTLTIDPDSRPTASEALKHPWMIYAASLTEDDVKYPSP